MINTKYPIMPSQGPVLPLKKPDSSQVSQASDAFGNLLKNTIDQVNEAQIQGEQAIQDLQTGNAENLHEVMIAVEQADISLRMLVQLRNKAQQAYEEIMRLQI